MISVNDFLKLPTASRQKYFDTAAAKLGLSEPIIEKDFWVSFVLFLLFTNEHLAPHLTFKGGTSLSKGFNITRRFSEDVDITIEKELFGFTGINRPENSGSSNKERKMIEQLKQAASTYVAETILPFLDSTLRKYIDDDHKWALEIDATDIDQQTILFHFPSQTSSSQRYISPTVKIEFGARGEHWPVVDYNLNSSLGEALGSSIDSLTAIVKVLSPVRTIWEKATILHALANHPHGKIMPIRQSRHYYDLHCLINSQYWSVALDNMSLLEDVCRHKMVYFRSAAARYQEILDGEIKLNPAEHIMETLQSDYESMKEMLFDQPQTWNEIMQSIKKAEADINSLRKAQRE